MSICCSVATAWALVALDEPAVGRPHGATVRVGGVGKLGALPVLEALLRRLGLAAPHALAGPPLVLLPSSHFDLVGGLAAGLVGLQPDLRRQEALQPGTRIGEVFGDLGGRVLQAAVLLLVGGPCFGDDPLHLGPDPVLGAVGAGRGVGLD